MATKTQKTSTPKPPASFTELMEGVAKLPQNVKYKSAAAVAQAVHEETPGPLQTRLRQLKRDAGEKVGRGNRYTDITPGALVKLHKAAQANQQQKKDAAKAARAKKAATKETVEAAA